MKVKGNLIVDGNVIGDNVPGSVTFTDGTNSHTSNTLNFSSDDFYVSTNLSGQPVANLLSTSIPKFQVDAHLTGDASEIVFDNIPATANFLEFKYALRSTISATSDTIRLQMNDDTGSNYHRVRLLADQGAAPAATLANAGTEFIFPEGLGGTATSNSFGSGHVVVSGYSDPAINTSLSAYSAISESSSLSTVTMVGGTWINTSVVTKIRFFFAGGNIAANSRITMIGV